MNVQQSNLYEQDFNVWVYDTVNKLKSKNFEALDIENVIEEIEGLAARDKRELFSRIVILLAHLIKWQYQPSLRCGSWRGSIRTQRREINLILTDSPSLKKRSIEINKDERMFKKVLKDVVNDTGLQIEFLPKKNPYKLEDVLNEDFYPKG
jgi:hypothetical protein